MSLFIDRNKAIYFDSLKTEYTLCIKHNQR